MAQDRIYLTVGPAPDGDLLAIISQGTPQRGDETCTVLEIKSVVSSSEAKTWFNRMLVEHPWEVRN